MIVNCEKCGKEIYLPDSWILHQSAYQPVLCSDCKAEKQNLYGNKIGGNNNEKI